MVKMKVFRSGNSQAVRIPREFQFDTKEVEILRRDDEIILRKPRKSLVEAFDILTSLEDFVPDVRRQPKHRKVRPL